MAEASLAQARQLAVALVKTNNEILQRCLPHKISQSSVQGVATNSLEFYRLGFDVVKVYAGSNGGYPNFNTPSEISGSNGGLLHFTTKSGISRKPFQSPTELPSVLSDILPIGITSPDEVLHNYEDYISKTAMLHNDILSLFFVVLKDHLKTIQVALGEIDSWHLEPVHVVQFLNNQFGVHLQVPGHYQGSLGGAVTELLAPVPLTCLKCFRSKAEHVPRRSAAPVFNFNGSGYVGSTPRHTGTLTAELLLFGGGGLGTANAGTQQTPSTQVCTQESYFKPESWNLKSVSMPVGEISMSFKVSEESERVKLEKFLEFASVC
ncbi:expressed unknown protein [Seminavis robusta]|uniref:Uncharacterized protein n=1 Tax=Seminavis robusta TaxID=568900 RepID=A0A9N8DSK3_9STRA|nr:expressed unknown protein [Seminavis robusta]|eukprot:Sro220_g090820.1 n/a (321) ;mRNA; r:80621-81652